MKLSEKAWNKSFGIYQQIIDHPFNQELVNGTLAINKLAYYIEQDELYLSDYVKANALIVSRVPDKYASEFLKHAYSGASSEIEKVHNPLKESFNMKLTGQVTPATLTYTSYLLKVSSEEPVEIALAAILPCFWVYRELGHYMLENSIDNNPYQHWINSYSNTEFDVMVDDVINVFDELADNSTEAIQEQMLEAFYHSTNLELMFWNDAYNLVFIDS